MPAPIQWSDVKKFAPDITEEVADAMIVGVWARARKLAPCLEDPDSLDNVDQDLVNSILVGIVVRWHESGSGAVTQRGAGDFSESLGGYSGGLFRPDEIRDLQQMCAEFRAQKANTIPTWSDEGPIVQHAAWCSIRFGSTACDCGAELSGTGLPLWVR